MARAEIQGTSLHVGYTMHGEYAALTLYRMVRLWQEFPEP